MKKRKKISKPFPGRSSCCNALLEKVDNNKICIVCLQIQKRSQSKLLLNE